MWTKIAAIARKDLLIAFKDRNALLLMFAMPVVISTIIGLAFGASGDISIAAVPVAVVNQDQGAQTPSGEAVNLGETIARAFVPSGDPALDADFAPIHALVDGTRLDDLKAARAQVEDGELAALIAIGPSFTADALSGAGPVTIHVYSDSGRSIGPSIVRSIVGAITNGMNTAILAQRIAPAALAQIGAAHGADQATIGAAIAQASAQAIAAGQDVPIRLEPVDLQGETRTLDMLQYFAPSMAILFMTFAMANGAISILQESRAWTLQRILTTPTPRWAFMAGKLLGIFLTGLVQMIGLIGLTLAIARVLGRTAPVWGTNVAGIALLLIAVVFAGTSIGLLIAALARTPSQASSYSTVALFVLAMLGGTFIPIEGLPDAIAWLPKLTMNYWGIQGFFALSYDRATLPDIAPNLIALVGIGVALCALSLWRFIRRADLGG